MRHLVLLVLMASLATMLLSSGPALAHKFGDAPYDDEIAKSQSAK